jgi:hypothetical protein
MPRKKTREEFIADARKVHGDRYDYSKVNYQGSAIKVCIICREHGDFMQKPNSHLMGQGCPTCAGHVKKSQEDFITKARLVHGDKYSYDKAVYKNDSTKVIVTCPVHGDFQITPGNHIRLKQGCRQCAQDKRGFDSRLTQEEFVKRATEKHHGKYSYNKVRYRDSHTMVIITCPIHGDFKQLPYHHLNGHGCRKCATQSTIEKESISLDEFIERSRACHTIEYDYSKVVIRGAHSTVRIICPIHGEFKQVVNTHMRGADCPKCSYRQRGDKKIKSQEQFVEDAIRVHGDKYDYSVTVYESALKKVAICCKKHNMVFWQKPNAHLNGNGCPICAQSRLETDVLRMLKSQKIAFEVEKTFDWLVYKGNLFLDFFLPDYSVAIECQGEQHFHACDYYGGEAAFRETKKRDLLKRKLCKDHGIRVLYYSDLGIKYPYDVIENLETLLRAIKERGLIEVSLRQSTLEAPQKRG